MKALPKRTVAIAGMCALAFSGALLAGCSSSNTDQEILDKLNQVETELAELKGNQSGNTDASGAADGTSETGADASSAAANQNAAATNGSAQSAAATTSADMEAAIADYEARVADAVATADAVAAPQNPNDRVQTYFDAKAPLEVLEHESDTLEDQAEALYYQGAIDQATFWKYDQRISAADDSLDKAADGLEWRLGVDD